MKIESLKSMNQEKVESMTGCGRSLGNLGVKCGDMQIPNPYRIEAPKYHLCKRCLSETKEVKQ